jgi:hypothetical protein
MMQTGSEVGRQRLYPLSPARFLIKETSSRHFETSETELAFTSGVDGKAQRLDLFVNGVQLPGHAVRMSPGAAQRAIDHLAAIAARVERQVPVPGGAEALRRRSPAFLSSEPSAGGKSALSYARRLNAMRLIAAYARFSSSP